MAPSRYIADFSADRGRHLPTAAGSVTIFHCAGKGAPLILSIGCNHRPNSASGRAGITGSTRDPASMTAGREVIENYRSKGLTLGDHRSTWAKPAHLD
jgi:hypothetical protein